MPKVDFFKAVYKALFMQTLFSPLFHPAAAMPHTGQVQDIEKYLDHLGLEVQVPGTRQNSSAAILAYGNHHCWLDGFIVAVALRPQQYQVVALAVNQWVFPFWHNHIIPVPSRGFPDGWNLRGFKDWLARGVENLPVLEQKRLRGQVTQMMADKLRKKETVVIFPDGGFANQPWFAGIGFAIDTFKASSSRSELWLQPFKITQITEFKLFVHLWRRYLWPPTRLVVPVYLGQPLPLSELSAAGLFEEADPKIRAKAITSYLEKKYQQEFFH